MVHGFAAADLSTITGETTAAAPYHSSCGLVNETNWLNLAIGQSTTPPAKILPLGGSGKLTSVAPSSFVAVASYCIDCHVDHTVCNAAQLVNNNCAFQRQHADEDIGLWAGNG